MALAAKLTAIYDEMRARQLRAIREAGAFRSDPYFVPDARRRLGGDDAPAATGTRDGGADDRRCLAISAVIDPSVTAAWTADYRALEGRLRDDFGEYGVLFSQDPAGDGGRGGGIGGGGQLHWTLMQLASFADYAAAAADGSTFISDPYLDCIRDSLTVGGLDTSVDVTYVGVVAVATGLLMVGIPSSDVNVARDAIRHRLARRELPLLEPFVNDIVHSTLFRVTGDAADHPPDLHDRLLALAAEFETALLGTVTLDRFQVGAASWRMLGEEVAATPPLRVWTLSSRTPGEHYGEALCAEGGANHYTVSGASGSNLALELKQNLSRGVLAGSRVDLTSGADIAPAADVSLPRSEGGQDSGGVEAGAGVEYDTPLKEPAAANSHFTVSGASGAKLASELRQNLSRGMLAVSKAEKAAAGTSAGEDEVLPELRKQIEEERRALERLYNLDFY